MILIGIDKKIKLPIYHFKENNNIQEK